MGIIGKDITHNPGKKEMTIEQFKDWLMKSFDSDNDGKINKDELAEALRRNGEWFAGFKGKRGVRFADANGNGVIDGNEIGNLKGFAEKHFGIKIIGL